MIFDYTKDGAALTEQFEGCKLEAYQDQVGVWTIGYGHTEGVYSGQVITQDEAENFVVEDVQKCVHAINRDVKVELTQDEFNALVDFSFNLGIGALEHSTLWKLVQEGDFDAAANQFVKWDRAGGKEVAGLIRRRLAEKAEFQA